MMLRRSLLALAVVVAALAANDAPGRAEYSPQGHVASPFAGAPIFSDGELVEMRAGFVMPWGLKIEFGALARTLVDGQMMHETVFSFSDDNMLPIAPAVVSGIERAVPGLTIIAGGESDSLAAGTPTSRVDVSALLEAPGVLFRDANGAVAGLSRVAPGQALNLVVAAGVNQQIEQQLNLIFSVTGFARFQQDMRDAMVTGRFMNELAPH